jgi:uncharacterized protein (DUF433 family)
VNVWGLVAWRRRGLADTEILQAVQGLTQADLDAAWASAAERPDEIDAALRRNAEA